MKISLTQEQVEEVALAWIKQQQDKPGGYKKVLAVLFTGGHFAKWSWFDALTYAASICSKAYSTDVAWIAKNLEGHNVK